MTKKTPTWFAKQLTAFAKRNNVTLHREIAELLGESRENITRWLGGSLPSRDKQDEILRRIAVPILNDKKGEDYQDPNIVDVVSEDVELYKEENERLRKENEALKKQLAGIKKLVGA